MNWIILLLITAITGTELPEVRQRYQQAAENEKVCEKLIESLSSFNENNNPTLGGYRAAATMMMARHTYNPFSKLSYFRKGRNLLQKCINANSNNVELRYLRYTIQTNIPSFLGYDDHLKQDRSFLMQSLNQLNDTDLKNRIQQYLTSR